MKSPSKLQTEVQPESKKVERIKYEAPAVVYEGYITTRAGSPINRGGADTTTDPADIFGDD